MREFILLASFVLISIFLGCNNDDGDKISVLPEALPPDISFLLPKHHSYDSGYATILIDDKVERIPLIIEGDIARLDFPDALPKGIYEIEVFIFEFQYYIEDSQLSLTQVTQKMFKGAFGGIANNSTFQFDGPYNEHKWEHFFHFSFLEEKGITGLLPVNLCGGNLPEFEIMSNVPIGWIFFDVCTYWFDELQWCNAKELFDPSFPSYLPINQSFCNTPHDYRDIIIYMTIEGKAHIFYHFQTV